MTEEVRGYTKENALREGLVKRKPGRPPKHKTRYEYKPDQTDPPQTKRRWRTREQVLARIRELQREPPSEHQLRVWRRNGYNPLFG